MDAPLLRVGGSAADVDDPRRRRWELLVVATLAIAYALTVSTSRNALFTAKSRIEETFGPQAYGNINSVGYATYGVGKLVYGSIVDLPRVGGRVAFVYCLVGTGLFTTLMSWARTEEQFVLCWGLARATQASGWIAMIKIVTAWTPAKRLGRVMAGCNLSSYLGDFATRLLIGAVLAAGADWRAIFWMSGATIGVMLVATVVLVRPDAESMGMAPVGANRHSVVKPSSSAAGGAGGDSSAVPELSCAEALRLLCSSAEFWAVMLLSVCLQTTREAFNTNSADLLATQGASDAASAALSSAFPLMGVPACVFFGWLIDRYDRQRNGEILAVSLTLLLIIMALLCGWLWKPPEIAGVEPFVVVAVLLLAAGFTLIGPYSLLAGVFAGDLGGPGAAATACGLIDFAGYCGSIVLMLVGGRPPFAGVEGQRPYLLLFAVFGLAMAAAAVVLSGGLICVKKRSQHE